MKFNRLIEHILSSLGRPISLSVVVGFIWPSALLISNVVTGLVLVSDIHVTYATCNLCLSCVSFVLFCFSGVWFWISCRSLNVWFW